MYGSLDSSNVTIKVNDIEGQTCTLATNKPDKLKAALIFACRHKDISYRIKTDTLPCAR